jgi:hypothetical protein
MHCIFLWRHIITRGNFDRVLDSAFASIKMFKPVQNIIIPQYTHRFEHGRVERHPLVLLILFLLLLVSHSRWEWLGHEAQHGQAVNNRCMPDVKLILNPFIRQYTNLAKYATFNSCHKLSNMWQDKRHWGQEINNYCIVLLTMTVYQT